MQQVKIKPFQQQGKYTIFDNVILDHIIPNVSGNAWKILSVIIRKTVGWHKEHDELSFSQIRRLTGIRSDATVAKSLAALEKAGYIRVDRFADQWASNIYALNLDFEVEIDIPAATTTEIEEEWPATVFEAATEIEADSTTKNVVEAATEIEVGSTTVFKDTKERGKQKKTNKNKDSQPKKPTPAQEMFSALADLCKYDLGLITEKERGQLNQAEKKMRENGYVPADLTAFEAWWYAEDWRGQKGQPPVLNDIRQTWGQFREYQKNGGNTHATNQRSGTANQRRSGIKGLRELGSDNPVKEFFDIYTLEAYWVDCRTNERVHPDGCQCYDCHPENRAINEQFARDNA